MPRMGIILETPTGSAPSGAVVQGMPIITLLDYEINREINAAGTWSLRFPASERLARQIGAGWRVSVIEEGRTGTLMYQGVVTDHTFQVAMDGTAIVSLQGLTRVFMLSKRSTHQGLAYAATHIYDISGNLADEVVELFGDTIGAPNLLTVTYNDTSKLQALLSAVAAVRLNFREDFTNGDAYQLTLQDDVPDSGFRFINVEHAGPELDNAATDGIGLIAGTPSIAYSAQNLANQIIPVGADWDGKPLTLGTSDRFAPYAILTDSNPDSTSYYYLEDTASVEKYGVIEYHYVRSDVKNPSNDPGTLLGSSNVLYAVTAAEMLRRRSEVISFACEIANGASIDAQVGDRVHLQYRGAARTADGKVTWVDLDGPFLVMKRRDGSDPAGVRRVSFVVANYVSTLSIPSLPDAVPIPTPLPNSVPHDPPVPRDHTPDEPPSSDTPPSDTPPASYAPPDGQTSSVPYQPCCADPTTDLTDGAETPPEDIVPPPAPDPGVWSLPLGYWKSASAPWTISLAEGEALFLRLRGIPGGGVPTLTGNSDADVYSVGAPPMNTGGAVISDAFFLAVGRGSSPEITASNFVGEASGIRVTSGVDVTDPLVASDVGFDDGGGVIPAGAGSVNVPLNVSADQDTDLVLMLVRGIIEGWPNPIHVLTATSTEAGKTSLSAVDDHIFHRYWACAEDPPATGTPGSGSNVTDLALDLVWTDDGFGSPTTPPLLLGAMVRLRKEA